MYLLRHKWTLIKNRFKFKCSTTHFEWSFNVFSAVNTAGWNSINLWFHERSELFCFITQWKIKILKLPEINVEKKIRFILIKYCLKTDFFSGVLEVLFFFLIVGNQSNKLVCFSLYMACLGWNFLHRSLFRFVNKTTIKILTF